MRTTPLLFSSALIDAPALILFGCAGAKPSSKKMPDRINQGSGAFKTDGKKAFCGVWSVVGVGNRPSATDAAEKAFEDLSKEEEKRGM